LPWGVTTLVDKILRFGFRPHILRTVLARSRLVLRVWRNGCLLQKRLGRLFLGSWEGMSRFVHDSEGRLLISQVRIGRGALRLLIFQIVYDGTVLDLQILVQPDIKSATRERLRAVHDSTGILLVFALLLSPTYLEIGSLDFLGWWCQRAFSVKMSDNLILDAGENF